MFLMWSEELQYHIFYAHPHPPSGMLRSSQCISGNPLSSNFPFPACYLEGGKAHLQTNKVNPREDINSNMSHCKKELPARPLPLLQQLHHPSHRFNPLASGIGPRGAGGAVYEPIIWPDHVSCFVCGAKWVSTTSTA